MNCSTFFKGYSENIVKRYNLFRDIPNASKVFIPAISENTEKYSAEM